MVKRLCLFAGYGPSGRVEDYVLYYIRALGELADVCYMADCDMRDGELEKLSPYTKNAWAFRHGKYDFGSWQELINKLGWDKIAQYDELILCNDSCFGPFYPLKPIFDRASDDNKCDFWGVTEGRQHSCHLQSYFLVLKKKAFTSSGFRSLINSVRAISKDEIVKSYEAALTEILQKEGLRPKKLARSFLSPYDHWKTLLKEGIPFFKVLTFTEKGKAGKRESLVHWEKFIRRLNGYDTAMIRECIKTRGTDPAYFNSVGYRFRAFARSAGALRKRLFRVNLKKDRKIVRILGFSLINAYENSIPSFDNRV